MFIASFLFALQSTPATAPVPSPPESPPPSPASCASDAHAQFDFWLGEWDVFPASNPETKIADSQIERKHQGCAVVENWMPLSGRGGTSLNHLEQSTGLWRQKWVGSSPGAVEFSGGVTEGAMVLTGNWPSPAAAHQLVRMTYTRNADGSVRQFGESSTDHGVSWQASFDFTYRRKQDAPQ